MDGLVLGQAVEPLLGGEPLVGKVAAAGIGEFAADDSGGLGQACEQHSQTALACVDYLAIHAEHGARARFAHIIGHAGIGEDLFQRAAHFEGDRADIDCETIHCVRGRSPADMIAALQHQHRFARVDKASSSDQPACASTDDDRVIGLHLSPPSLRQ